jgi:hypothetical protein
MKSVSNRSLRFFILLLAPILGGACIAQAAGPAQTPQIVVVTSTGDAPLSDQTPEAQTTEQTPALDLTSTPTVTSVTMTAGQDLSCVKGPHWVLYDWVARINEGETVLLLARSTADWPDYYYVRTGDGKECWAFSGSSSVSGDPSTLPEREAPPLPTVTYVIENRTYSWITDFYIRGKDETAWGANRIGVGSVPEYGETFSITITAGFYDVLIKDNHGGIHYQKEDIAIGSEPSSRLVVINDRVDFYWDNTTGQSICRILALAFEVGDEFELHKPADGNIAPGARAQMNALAGYYLFYFHKCGDDANVLTVHGVLVPGFDGIAPV